MYPSNRLPNEMQKQYSIKDTTEHFCGGGVVTVRAVFPLISSIVCSTFCWLKKLCALQLLMADEIWDLVPCLTDPTKPESLLQFRYNVWTWILWLLLHQCVVEGLLSSRLIVTFECKRLETKIYNSLVFRALNTILNCANIKKLRL